MKDPKYVEKKKREIQRHAISTMHKKFYSKILRQKEQLVQLKLVEMSQKKDLEDIIWTDQNSSVKITENIEDNSTLKHKVEQYLKQTSKDFVEM